MLEASLASQQTASAISKGSAMRPRGMAFSMSRIQPSGMPSMIGVLVGPGATTFTRMRRDPNSRAKPRVNPIRAALLVT